MISEGWYREIMPKLKARFEDRTMTAPKDEGILSDLRSLRVVRGVARVPETRSKDAHGTKRHGDAAVALAMLLYVLETMDNEEPWECVTESYPVTGGGINFAGF